ncbi:hypothetical protein H072_2297 [Dactylellina haptotyla CBS 200.50]|uniref:Uncharacterized protein n=1 Tax=Dactylellina haptotyla (strain CBS 200.50) TaxID=1284197 RepID=S8C7I7_DACHA|nr:hypothetical protein H072_2297 [Dactylellina haptotyla CBS 200.50]
MSSLALRPLARRQHQIIRSTFRRYATESAPKSTADSAAAAAAKAQETAANVAAKAQQMFNKGMAAAGPMAAKLGQSINSAPASSNKLVGTVQGAIPHVVYYSKVFAELAKHVYRGQQMRPPSLEAFQNFYRPYVGPLLNPSGWWGHIKSIRPRISALPDPETALHRAQAIPKRDLAQYAILAAECLGFYTVGTMIGRRKIVGYRGGVKEHH